ncbi:putative tyrosine--tRNA ligase, mitochondrial, partial [Stegodyphus mimosarum]
MAASIVYNMYRLKVSPLFYKYHVFKQVRHSSSDFLYNLIRRGLVKEIFPSDRPINCVGNPCAYAGFDATSDSLHIGNLLVLIALLHWRKAGYE